MLFGRRQVSTAARARPTLESIYREHFDFVLRKAARLGGPQLDAEDIAQEVFLVVQRRLETFDGTSLMTTWLYGITLNVVRQMRRAARTRTRLDPEHGPAPTERTVDAAELREAHRIAYDILDRMAPKKREAFILAELEEMTCEEIAAVVGVKTETVWSRLHYARKEFAERLARRELSPSRQTVPAARHAPGAVSPRLASRHSMVRCAPTSS